MTRYNIINGQQVQFTEEQELEWDELERQAPAQLLALQSAQVREERDAKLAETDWMASSDLTMSSEWVSYRSSLRDVPSQSGFPNTITWPTKPE
jgi:hypothetical protein